MTSTNVSVVAADASRQDDARQLASRWNLPITTEVPGDGYALRYVRDRLELVAIRGGESIAASVEFAPVRRRADSSRKQPLARALGRDTRRVLDATAGFGQDAWLIAQLGCDVVALERHPIVFAILDDGWHRFLSKGVNADSRLPDAIQRLRFEHADARHVLSGLAAAASCPYDACIIDPMFPPKRKRSALPKKEIQLLKGLVGDDADAGALLQAALSIPSLRVIVKRPTHAPPLVVDSGRQPTHQHEGKLVRYDVYSAGVR